MSNTFPAKQVLTVLVPEVQSAWGLTRVAVRRPRTRQLELPYAVIWLESLAASLHGRSATVGGVEQTMRFGILGRFAFPSETSQNVELLKLDRANELVAALQTGATFGEAIFPLVAKIAFEEADLPLNAAYEVTAYFDVVTTASHH